MTESGHLKVVSLIAGFLGVVIVLANLQEMTRRQMVAVAASGLACAYFLTPVALAWIKVTAGGLPNDEAVTGAIGLVLGIVGINVTGALMASGGSIRESLSGAINRIFGGR